MYFCQNVTPPHMSKFVTCDFCKTTGKYQPNCNCYREEIIRNIARLNSGCFIEESFIHEEAWSTFLVQKFRSTDGNYFYMRTCIKGQECWRMIMEISEQEFLNYKRPVKSIPIPTCGLENNDSGNHFSDDQYYHVRDDVPDWLPETSPGNNLSDDHYKYVQDDVPDWLPE